MVNGSNPRHCMVVHAYYPLGETRVQREAAALRASGWDVEVICLRRPTEPRVSIVDGVHVRRLPVSRHRDSGMLVQLVEYLSFLILATLVVGWRHLYRRYDTVQVHNLPDFLVFSAIVPKLSRTPVLLDVHDLMPEFFAARTGLDASHPLSRVMALEERASLAFADHVITVTEGWRQTLAARGADPNETSVVMNAADPAIFAPREAAPESDEFVIVYHGTFTERYGVLLLVRAMADLSIEGARLHLLGDGDIRDEIVALVEELKLGDIVTLSPGMLDASQVVPVIESASVGVVPNLSNVFTDGLLPTKLLEYVAVRVPVVAARTPMIESYFADDQVAYFEPGNMADLVATIEKLHANPDLGAEMAANAARFCDVHGWAAESARYVALLDRLSARSLA